MNSTTLGTEFFLTCLLTLYAASAATAQPQPTLTETAASANKAAVGATTTAPKIAATKLATNTAWRELSPAQQQALKPLAASWNDIDEAQKRKWLAMSRNFGTWSASEQSKLHSRMTDWVALSPRQRSQARLNFAETKKIPADEKKARWESYQTLSPEEKNRLAAKAASQPPGVANALKPVPAQKLAATNPAKPPGKAASGTTNMLRQVDKNTLLPRPSAVAP